MLTKNDEKEDLLNCLYDKTYKCPVCESSFKDRTVKQKSIRLVDTDSDLRPRYTPIDPILYEIVLCPICGYASLSRAFDDVTYRQAENIKKLISSKYVARSYPKIFTPEIALERYKLAYANAMVLGVKTSHKAYLQMKAGWVYRSLNDSVNELKMLKNAYDGFLAAIQTEKFPIMEFDEETVMYLLGEFSRRLGDIEEAKRWFSRVLGKRDAIPKLKERIRNQLDIIKEMDV